MNDFTLDDERIKIGRILGERYGSIAGESLLARHLLNQEPRSGFGRRVARRIVSRVGRDGKQPRMPIVDCRRRRGSHSHVVSVRANHHDCRRGREDQIHVICLGEPDPRIADGVSLAIWVWRVFGESIKRRGGARVHSTATGTSREAVVPRRTARMVTAVRDCMGRTVRVGLKRVAEALDERPLQGRAHGAGYIPRPPAWADRTSLSGSDPVALPRPEGAFRPGDRTSLSSLWSIAVLSPEGASLPAQGEALGSLRATKSTLKGSFIDAPPPKPRRRKKNTDEQGGGEA